MPPIVVFDFYGTLFSLDAVTEGLRIHAAGAEAIAGAWRARQLELAFAVAGGGPYQDFDAVTAAALRDVAPALAGDPAIEAELLAAWRRLQPFPDTPPALARLRAAGATLAILSNGSPPSLAEPLRRAGLDGTFDAVLSASAARSLKPNPGVYTIATTRFGVEPGAITFVSANDWDAAAAARFGFAVVRCARSARVVRDLGGLADLLGAPA